MKASELILKLQELVATHGDYKVVNDMDDELIAVEYNAGLDDPDPAIVLVLGE